MAIRRIKRELKDLNENPPIACRADTIDEDFYHWTAYLTGPSETPYENGIFHIDIRFPLDYPFSPPKIVFTTKIYHPNINTNGNICLDILKDNWSPVLTVSKIILSLSSLLSDPNPDDPLVTSIAQLYRDDYNEWFKRAKEHTKKWALKEEYEEEGKLPELDIESKEDELTEESELITVESELIVENNELITDDEVLITPVDYTIQYSSDTDDTITGDDTD